MIGPVFSLRRELLRQLQLRGDAARLSECCRGRAAGQPLPLKDPVGFRRVLRSIGGAAAALQVRNLSENPSDKFGIFQERGHLNGGDGVLCVGPPLCPTSVFWLFLCDPHLSFLPIPRSRSTSLPPLSYLSQTFSRSCCSRLQI